jgi:single-strand DNA-binding protein|tara:strand:- start:137 stop:619 length:483 start_codon:yes stop_codon:yes gene_type:complete
MAKGTLNKVLLIGRLGQDPEIRFSPNGTPVANFSIATNESWKNKEGTQEERTDWHRCVAFGVTVEKFIEPYVKKGSLVCVEGRLQTEEWKDKEENKRLSTKVVVNPFGGIQLLGSFSEASTLQENMNQEPKISEENTSQDPEKAPAEEETTDVQEDDLPF